MRRRYTISNPTYTYKLSLITTSNNSVIYETDSITTMFTYLSTYTLVANTTLRFNTSDNFLISSTLNITNNTIYTLNITNITGFNPSIDGQNTLGTLFGLTGGNFIINGIIFKNALVQASDIGQTIMRIYGGSLSNNITIKFCIFSHGYCAIRGTDIIKNLTIQDCKVYQVDSCSFRLGNGLNTFPDITNLIIERCQLIDDLNGGIIPNGTGSSMYQPLMLLKGTQGLRVSNCRFNQTQQGIIAIESSNTVIVENIISTNGGIAAPGIGLMDISYSTNIIVRNYYAYPSSTFTSNCLIINYSSNIKVYYCTLLSNGQNQGALSLFRSNTVQEIAGNIIQQGIYYPVDNRASYIGTLATDYVSENNNVIMTLQTFDGLISISNLNIANIQVQIQYQTSFSSYQSTYTRGQSSVSGISTLLLINNYTSAGDKFVPSSNSIGYKLVQSQISTITTDTTGKIRTYPTNPGAFD